MYCETTGRFIQDLLKLIPGYTLFGDDRGSIYRFIAAWDITSSSSSFPTSPVMARVTFSI